MRGGGIIKNHKKILRRIFDIAFWIIIISLGGIWITDFVQVKREKEPMFCLKETIYKYDDGTVNECIGLGYKVYSYKRTSLNIVSQFSPFFVKMKE